MQERGEINRQDRGHDTHPIVGYLPDDNTPLIGVYAGPLHGIRELLGHWGDGGVIRHHVLLVGLLSAGDGHGSGRSCGGGDSCTCALCSSMIDINVAVADTMSINFAPVVLT